MSVTLSLFYNLTLKVSFLATRTEHFCKKCNATVSGTADWHHKPRHQQTADHVVYPDEVEVTINHNKTTDLFHCVHCESKYPDAGGMRRHAKSCHGISEQEVPEDIDQPAPGATPFANPALLGRTDSFDPADRQSLSPRRHSTPFPRSPIPLADSEWEFELDLSQYSLDTPDAATVITYDGVNLPACALVINTLFRICICISCGYAVTPGRLVDHIHSSFGNLTAEIVDKMVHEFDLHPSLANIPLPQNAPAPIFGLSLEDRLYFFCACGHGYVNQAALRAHQGSPRCNSDDATVIRGYGQSFTRGAHHTIFRVDPKKLPQRNPDDPSPANLFVRNQKPMFDYSRLPMVTPDRDLDLANFARREGWLGLAEENNLSPVDMDEIVRGSTDEDGDLHELKPLVIKYINNVQPMIKRYTMFGLHRLMANIGINPHSLATFNILTKDSQQKYGLTLWCLIFSLLRHHRDELDTFDYPLTDAQSQCLKDLDDSILAGSHPDTKLKNIHKLVHALFSHRKHDNRLGKFFSAINCYAVFTSFNPTEATLRRASTITSTFMQLMYVNRTAQMTEMRRLMDADPSLQVFDAYRLVKEFLVDMDETPMAFLFESYALLKVISSDEYTDQDASFQDELFTKLNYQGETVRLRDFKTLLVTLQRQYATIVKEEIFFNDEELHPDDAKEDQPINLQRYIPEDLVLMFDLLKIRDNPHNRAAGYSFLEHPENRFDRYSTSYGRWLLSDRERAERFVYINNGELVWRPDASEALMHSFDAADGKLVLRCGFSAGGSARGTDVAAQSVRNRPACAIRNVQFLFHNLTLITIQDKTTHNRMKDRFVPKTPAPSVSEDLVYSLVVFRNFRTSVARELLDDEAAHRFHESLWPRLFSNLTSAALSSAMGDITEEIMNVCLPMTRYRKTVGTFAKKHANPLDFEGPAGIPPEHIIGCIRHSILWQKLLNIDQDRVLTVTAVGPDLVNQLGPLVAQNDAPAAVAVDTNSVIQGVVARLEPRLEATINDALSSGFQRLQSIFLPPVPLPDYSSHHLRPVSDIRPHASHLQQFRDALGNNDFVYRYPEQAVLVEKIVLRDGNVLIIMRCGSGKTFFVLLCVKLFSRGRQTIFILPHSGLHEDLRRRANDLQIKHSEWKPNNEFDPQATLIYVAVEYIEFDQFNRFVKELCRQDRLAWFYFEEAHKVWTDRHYREIFDAVPKLVQYGVPILAASASIPDQNLPAFARVTGVEDWQIIRMRVSRPNVKLRFCSYGDMKQTQLALVEYATDQLKKYGPEDRMMIFCPMKQYVKALAPLFNTEPYFSRQDPKEREKNNLLFNAWRKGHPKVVISTSLLGSGVDYDAVRDTINFGYPWSMFDLQQQIDRGGCDNLPCRQGPQREGMGDKYMIRWADGGCLQEQISSFLDGSAQTCLTIPSLLCERCESELSSSPPSQPVVLTSHNPLPPYFRTATPTKKNASPAHIDLNGLSPNRSMESIARQWTPRTINDTHTSHPAHFAPLNIYQNRHRLTHNGQMNQEVMGQPFPLTCPGTQFFSFFKIITQLSKRANAFVASTVSPSTRTSSMAHMEVPAPPPRKPGEPPRQPTREDWDIILNTPWPGSQPLSAGPIRSTEPHAHARHGNSQGIKRKRFIVAKKYTATSSTRTVCPSALPFLTMFDLVPYRHQITSSSHALASTTAPAYSKNATQMQRYHPYARPPAAQARDNAPEPPSYRPAARNPNIPPNSVPTTTATAALVNPPPPKTPRVPPPSTPLDDDGDPISLVNPPYNQPAPVANKPLPGRVAQNPGQVAAEKVQKDTMEKLCNKTLDLLRSGCPTCWARGYANWNTHFWNKCGEVCAGDNDEGWNVFKDTWTMPNYNNGWCWGCLMPQKAAGGKHAFKPLNQCDVRNIMKPAVFAFIMSNKSKKVKPEDCPVWDPQADCSPDILPSFLLAPLDNPKPFRRIHYIFLWLAFMYSASPFLLRICFTR
ncbi:hypothetical protein B0H13DRAFT_2300317 [Mycena leptocephala]|nr:hypothetical protein B0H13DRAFT_2300317 [Mycena leptocephala]